MGEFLIRIYMLLEKSHLLLLTSWLFGENVLLTEFVYMNLINLLMRNIYICSTLGFNLIVVCLLSILFTMVPNN